MRLLCLLGGFSFYERPCSSVLFSDFTPAAFPRTVNPPTALSRTSSQFRGPRPFQADFNLPNNPAIPRCASVLFRRGHSEGRPLVSTPWGVFGGVDTRTA